MNYNFPKTKFAEQNTIGKQIEHVLSEADEVKMELLKSNERAEEELADLTHSLETLWRIVAAERGEAYVQQLFERVIEKNAERNYYVPESIPVVDNDKFKPLLTGTNRPVTWCFQLDQVQGSDKDTNSVTVYSRLALNIDESGENGFEKFAVVTLTRAEISEIHAVLDEDIEKFKKYCPGTEYE